MSGQVVMGEKPARRYPRLRIEWAIFILCLAGLIGTAICYFGPPIYKSVKMRMEIREFMKQAPQIRAEWNKEFGPLEDLPRQFPPQKKNESAIKVESLFAKLGLNEENEVKEKLNAYTKSQLESADASLAVPPQELADYFTRKQNELIAYRKQLVDGPIPQWDSDIKLGPISSPQPNLLMHSLTQRLFTAGSFMEMTAGHPNEAIEFLEAAWKLNQGLKIRPELTCQIIYISSARYQVGTLRWLSQTPAVWRERLQAMNASDSLHSSMAVEVYSIEIMYTKIGLGELKIPENKSLRFPPSSEFEKQIYIASILDMQKLMTWLVRGWKNVDACKQSDWPTGDEFEKTMEPWDMISAIAIPGVGKHWKRSNRLRLDVESTSKLLQARAMRKAAPDHLWPAAIPGIETTICRDQRWIYETSSDRKTMTLRYSAKLDWPGHKGPLLPMNFSE